jgi:membrane-associated phospholipid phosphatase
MTQNDPKHLELWAPWVQQLIYGFECVSRVGFSSSGRNGPLSAWHLKTGTPRGNRRPNTRYEPLVTFIRPPKRVFIEQLPYIDQYAALRPDRGAEILAQLGPPLDFFGSIGFLGAARTPWTIRLLLAAFGLAGHVEMRFKHGLACRRPNEFSPQIQPMIPTPEHGTLPSGHATEAFTLASVLWAVLRHSDNTVYREPEWGDQIMRLASRIAINRTVAGVHFPVDSAAGCLLGLTLGHYFVARCTGARGFGGWRFDGTRYAGDFDWHDLYDVARARQKETDFARSMGSTSLQGDTASPILRFLWKKAVEEWV